MRGASSLLHSFLEMFSHSIKLWKQFPHPTGMILCLPLLAGPAGRIRLRRLRQHLKSAIPGAAFLALCTSGAISYAQSTEPKPAELPKTSASTEQMLTSFEGQNVSSVIIAGRPDLDIRKLSQLIKQKGNAPFSEQLINESVAALKTSGGFEQVRIQVGPESKGIRVIFILEPAIYFGIFQFPGAERFAYARLAQVANYPPEAPFNTEDVEKDRRRLLRFFQQEGYFLAQVSPETSIDTQHHLANIEFHIQLGRNAAFGAIDIQQSAPAEVAALQRSLQTFSARIRGAAIRPGKRYNRSSLDKATQYLTNDLAKHDRLSAQVKLSGAEYHADSNRADIHFDVDPGPLTHVQIVGAHVFRRTEKNLLPVYQGIGVDDASVEEGRQALISYFQAKGYFDTKIESRIDKSKDSDTIVYSVDREHKHKVSAVDISGNHTLNNDDLKSSLAVEKSHFFSPGKFSDKLVRASVKNLAAVYAAQGFSSAQIKPTVVNHGGDVQITFRVTEGPRDIVSSLSIEGADTLPESEYAPHGLKLAVGKPYSQASVEADRASVLARYLQEGYLISSFRTTIATVAKNDPHHIAVTYHIDEGPRVYANDVITLGRVSTKQRLIDDDASTIQRGKPLTETELLTSESRLYSHTGVFDWAEVDTRRPITTQNSEDVLVKVHEAKKNQITYGFGFEVINRGGSIPSGTVVVPGLPPVGLPSNFATDQQTFYGPRGTFQYTRNNLRGKGETLSFTAFAGRLDQRGAVYYIDPQFLWSLWRATASFSGERNEQNPIFSSQQEIGSFEVQRHLDKAKVVSLFLRYSFSKTDLTRLEIPDLVLPEDQHVRLSTLAANVTRDTRDNPLDEHKGWLQTAEFAFSSSKLGSSVDFVKFTGQLANYKQIPHKIIWANSLRIGLAQPFNNSRVPISEAFFTGGGNSLRGFPLDGAGPQRPVQICGSGSSASCTSNQEINVPSGGNEMMILNSEFRIPLPIRKGLGMVAFYDGGNVFPSVGLHQFTSLYANNVGLGLRYATPVGPVRVDVGRNLNPVPGVNSTQYFISIGQAF